MVVQEQANYSKPQLLGGLEILNARFKQLNFSRHVHEGYTIGVIHSGAQRFWRSGAKHVAPRNSVILVNADQVHDGESACEQGWAYQAMYPTPEQLKLSLGTQYLPYFPKAVEFHPQLAAELSRFFYTVKNGESTLTQESALNAVLITLACYFSRKRYYLSCVAKHIRPLHQARDYLHAHSSENVSLTMLSQLAGLSAYHFIHQFKQVFGLPPHAYQLQLRLQRAKQLLAEPLGIIDVALAAGFHDQSHLNRHFKRAFGTTPGAYRKGIM